eukprot:SAG31_NODE_45_length_31062_cov_17.179957_6_plen_206_part_00
MLMMSAETPARGRAACLQLDPHQAIIAGTLLAVTHSLTLSSISCPGSARTLKSQLHPSAGWLDRVCARWRAARLPRIPASSLRCRRSPVLLKSGPGRRLDAQHTLFGWDRSAHRVHECTVLEPWAREARPSVPIGSIKDDTFPISALHLAIKVPYFSDSGHKNEKVTTLTAIGHGSDNECHQQDRLRCRITAAHSVEHKPDTPDP